MNSLVTYITDSDESIPEVDQPIDIDIDELCDEEIEINLRKCSRCKKLYGENEFRYKFSKSTIQNLPIVS